MKNLLTYCIALVWIVNGLYCKILNGVPRHQEIVGRILGEEYAWILTKAIGVSELFMAAWVLSGIRSKWNAMAQIVIVVTMNIIEFFLVPDLLLWGRFNALFALFFVVLVYYHGFVLKPNES